MEEWSDLRDDSSSHEDESVEEDIGTSCDLDFLIEECSFHASKERLRVLFDEVLVIFLREKSASKCIKPIPALCGDGRVVDLFKLFWVVRKIGGYDAVSRKNMWGFVVEECGLNFGAIPSIKLIYFKYLSELDQWLWQISKDTAVEVGQSGVLQKLDLLSRELETSFRGSLSDGREEQAKDTYIARLENFKSVKQYPAVIGRFSEKVDNPEFLEDSNKKFFCYNDFPLAQRLTGKFTCKIYDVSGRSADDNDWRFWVDNDLETSAKRVTEDAVNEVPSFSNGEIDDKGKSFVINDNKVVLGKKTINKVHYPTYIIVDNEYERFPAKEHSDGILAEKPSSKSHNLLENFIDEERKFIAQIGNDVVMSARNVVGTESASWKRKYESQYLRRMLNWMTFVAKHSDDPAIGKIPDCSKWKDYGHEEFWIQALFVRETLLIRRHSKRNADESLQQDQQKKLRVHPSVYEDNVPNHQSAEKLIRSTRLPSLTVSHPSSRCNSSEVGTSNINSHQKAKVESSLKEPVAATTNSQDQSEKHVFVGPLFQAKIPEWTGVLPESDSKWLGTHIWPAEDGKGKSTVEFDPIGKGRQQLCNCRSPNSVECMRFHIAEKRLKLKCELGLPFYRWKFNRMGEEVSLSWTKEEEQRFKDMMRLHAAFPKKFWNNARWFLPSKTREQLVSYYFNVFLVQRRSYQNRVCPNDIDSDDDEKECGSIGDSFGYKAINITSSRSITCTQNKECTDLA
ncbi:AT-rich interactive domain-containing 2-like isoform X1 [Olea europaea subsp. europaea]|uniref:AT-rich interactive domain-containing 2-like isoform X1 n=1 Tax=Olea europaea subsp. europaea TaxID=158383 RepID=A0A8S0PWP0_OLEEU|nr:AT-rich interactive domain-containing 2-like isoform X1 [Olea europaea subsp. europaea]